MYNIKMLVSCEAYEDGYTKKLYAKDSIYSVNESLFNSFKNMGYCELVIETQVADPVVEKKIIAPASDTKKKSLKKGAKSKN